LVGNDIQARFGALPLVCSLEPLGFVHGVMGDWLSWAPQWAAFTPHYH
jgi:hypothetical protein